MELALTSLFSSTIMSAVGSTIGVIGAISQGQAAADSANAQARQAEMNARIARQQASVKEDVQRRQARQELGNQRASAVQSGFDPNTGSLLEIQGDNAGALEFESLSTRYEGALQALNFDNQARVYRAEASNAKRQGYLNAAGSLFGSLGKYGGGGRISPAPVETRSFG